VTQAPVSGEIRWIKEAPAGTGELVFGMTFMPLINPRVVLLWKAHPEVAAAAAKMLFQAAMERVAVLEV
jgi:hypothetical protein